MSAPPAGTSEGIIADVLGGPPEVDFAAPGGDWRFSRWRHFVGAYALPALPEPLFVIHVAGKPRVRTWERNGWSQASSAPGCATLVPGGRATGWLVDGELDVVTLSLPRTARAGTSHQRFDRMRFAYADPLGSALARQIRAELYEPATGERDAYVAALTTALRAHVLRGTPNRAAEVPTSGFSAYRLHQLVNAILAHPEAPHSLDEMAAHAGVSPSHLCRVFRQATGFTPHQYVLKAKLDRAGEMLRETDAGIAAVAEHLGFAGQSHLTRAFRSRFGETPGEARRRARGSAVRPPRDSRRG